MASERSVEAFIVDFSKEESGGGIRFKPDKYKVRIAGAKTGTSEDKGTPYLELTLVVVGGKYNKKKFTERLYITPKSLSRFRTLLEAVDESVPKKLNVVKLIPKLKGKELYVEVDDDDTRDPVRSRVTFQGFINVDDYEPDEDEEDEEDEEEDLEEEDEDEDLEEEEDEEEEEPAPKRRAKRGTARRSSTASKRRATVDDEDEDEEDEEDEEPAPRKRRAAKKAPAKKASSKRGRKAAADDDEDEDDLGDLDLDAM